MLNLTQHNPTPEQTEQGVIALLPEHKQVVGNLLTFHTLPTSEEIADRAQQIAKIAAELGATKAMIGGAPYLMGALEKALKERNIAPFYSFTERVSASSQLKASVIQAA